MELSSPRIDVEMHHDARCMSRTQVPSQPSSQVTLTERQTALIDRFRASIRVATGTEPRREVAIGTLFQAFEKAESNLALFLFDAMRDQREP